MKNRDEEDMYVSILQILKEREHVAGRRGRGTAFTQLLGIVGAYFHDGNNYMDRMEKMKLISIHKDGSRAGGSEIRRCNITEKGIRVLKMLEERQKMLGIDFAR